MMFEMFDHVHLLANGRCMYDEAAKNTIGYYANLGLHCRKYHNPGDYMIGILSNERGNFSDRLKLSSYRLSLTSEAFSRIEKSKSVVDSSKNITKGLSNSSNRKQCLYPPFIRRRVLNPHQIRLSTYIDYIRRSASVSSFDSDCCPFSNLLMSL
ncbi:hypothetical protein HZH66_012662 [Vespula vulgaris]|uniref:ABC transporter family G domain-containing protein n=1 Tax=Vespula vulgaris TaxID=7454 RepID=A0A834JAH1_VESVU|nr:hypothetical protein HZH66_012662 [Vespula vulgaris]